MLKTADRVRDLLIKSLNPSHCTVVDHSHRHVSHNKDSTQGGTHIKICLSGGVFSGSTKLEKHREIYHLIKEEWAGPLHSVSIEIVEENA